MSQQKSKKTLVNWDLVTVNPNNKVWSWTDLFCFWGVNIQSIIGFSLITSLYVMYDLNTFVVLFGTIFASILIYFFSNLIGKPSQKFGLPFVVLLRSCLGFRGAKYFGSLRCIVGVFMFGIQTFFLSKALGYLIRIGLFSYDKTILEFDLFLIFFLGMDLIDWVSISFSMIVQFTLFSLGMNFNKKIINFSAVFVYLGMLIFFFAVLLSDVKFTTNAFLETLNLENFIDKNNLAPLITVTGTIFAYFSIVILSFGDFSRYVKNENELKKGNLSLMLNLFIFSFFALFIVIGADAFLKQNSDNLEKIFTNPTDIIGNLDDLLLTVLGLLFILIASASTNLIANFIPSQYSLINIFPSFLSLKSSSFIIVILAFVIGVFWLTFLSQIGILAFVDTIAAFFGPLFGIMITDYHLIKKGKLINKDIYSLEISGSYYFSGGWHIKGVYSLILGFIFSASTIWNSNFMSLQSFSWIIGAFVSSITYYLLTKE